MLAAIHLKPIFTVPATLLLVGFLVWYWLKLGNGTVPPTRRKIRRLATVIMGLTLPLLVLGLSVHDPLVNQTSYILTWTIVIGLVLLMILVAGFDIFNNVRLYQLQLRDEITSSLQGIEKAQTQAQVPNREDAQGDGALENGIS